VSVSTQVGPLNCVLGAGGRCRGDQQAQRQRSHQRPGYRTPAITHWLSGFSRLCVLSFHYCSSLSKVLNCRQSILLTNHYLDDPSKTRVSSARSLTDLQNSSFRRGMAEGFNRGNAKTAHKVRFAELK